MDKVINDKRFKHVASNPRFRNVPRKQNKVKIDKRFQALFTDRRFQLKYTVDSRGRHLNELQTENYKKYYDLSEESDESSVDEEKEVGSVIDRSECSQSKMVEKETVVEEANKGNKGEESIEFVKKSGISEEILKKEKMKNALIVVNKYVDKIHKNKLSDKIRKKIEDITIDYARGIGVLQSESSSDEPTTEDSDLEEIEHPWGEFDQDAVGTNEVTNRLAVCNMDWDRIKAKDLMVLFHSFLPSDGLIESVTIYPSEFGLARMAEEELKGPKELVEHKIIEEDEIEEGSLYQREKLRQYQLRRLRYYYGVVVCNTSETAHFLYNECDGWELESSATRVDLRFIPDDEVFNQKPRDVCTLLPDLKKYKPQLFINTALQQGKVDLTWDETDPNRIEFNRKIFEKSDEIDEGFVKSLIASASSDDSDEEEGVDYQENENESDLEKDDAHKISKYHSLITHLQKNENKMNKKKGDEESGDKRDVDYGTTYDDNEFEKDTEGFATDRRLSCVEFLETDGSKNNVKQNSKHGRNKFEINEVKNNENSKLQKATAELELLLCDTNNSEINKRHFSLDQIQKQEKKSKMKKKWKKKKNINDYQEEDSFKIDLADERFSAIYISHHFNIDPADPHFRKTKAMEQLIAEKLKRRRVEFKK